jgi:hypothetical protein
LATDSPRILGSRGLEFATRFSAQSSGSQSIPANTLVTAVFGASINLPALTNLQALKIVSGIAAVSDLSGAPGHLIIFNSGARIASAGIALRNYQSTLGGAGFLIANVGVQTKIVDTDFIYGTDWAEQGGASLQPLQIQCVADVGNNDAAAHTVTTFISVIIEMYNIVAPNAHGPSASGLPPWAAKREYQLA